MNNNNINDLEVNDTEYAFLTINTPKGAPSFDVMIPKLSPMNMARDKISGPLPIIDSGYKNAQKYKVGHAKVVTKKNWINVISRFYIPPGGGIFFKGHRFLLRFPNNNKLDRKIIDWN